MLMMDMAGSDGDSGPPSAAGREPRLTVSRLSHPTYDPMLLLSSIIHVHYRHLLIILHVNDCVTTLFAIGFAAPLVPSTASAHHGLFLSIFP
jgi:hypothetical protein